MRERSRSRVGATDGLENEGSVELGRVDRTSGAAGELFVVAFAEDPQNLLSAATLTLSGDPGEIAFRVRSARILGERSPGGSRVRVLLHGIESRERARPWVGATVSIPASALCALPEGEYYWRDLLGVRCRLPDGRSLGRIEEILPTASNDVLVVRDGERSVLVPALPHVLGRLDRTAGELWIEPPPGLLDEV